MHSEPSTLAPLAPALDDALRGAIMAQIRGPESPYAENRTACVLAYERVSTNLQVSIPDQRRAIEEDAGRHGLVVARHRFDVGGRWNNERSDYRALLEDIESKAYTHLWLFNADRLGGDDQEFVRTIERALRNGMVVRDTVHGPISGDMARILGLQSYWEIKNNHYRVVLKLEGKHLEGVKLGAVPVGYRSQCRLHPCRCGLHGRHVPDELLGPNVRNLFVRYAQGETLGACRRWWNNETGERRDIDRIRSILRNPYYVGVIVNCRERNGKVLGRGRRPKGEWKVGTHDHPLVDLATFATVQARLNSQENAGQHRQRRASHPLTGLVHCVGCDRRMRLNPGAGRRTAVWECPVCQKSRGEKKLERALHDVLATIPFPEDAAVADYAADRERMQRAVRQELAAIDAERDRIERRRSVWADDRGDDTMTKDEYRRKIAESDQQLEELRRQQAALQDSHVVQPGRAVLLAEVQQALREMGNWTVTLPGMTVDERRGVYRCLIKAMLLDLAMGTLTVEYTDALARWCGRSADTVALPSQKAR